MCHGSPVVVSFSVDTWWEIKPDGCHQNATLHSLIAY